MDRPHRLPVSCNPAAGLLHSIRRSRQRSGAGGIMNHAREDARTEREAAASEPPAHTTGLIGGEVIAIRRGSEKAKLLVGLRREACPHCHCGSLTVSIWSTLKGTTEQISWCGSC